MSETIQEPVSGKVSEAIETPHRESETFFRRLVGINEAATISRASKGQISRDTKSKRLAYTLDEKGQKRYTVADLYQLYGFREQKETSTTEPEKPAEINAETIKTAVEIAVLRAELKAKDEALRRMEEDNRDLRQTRDKLLDQNARMTLLLPAPPAITGAALAAPEPERSPEPPKRQPFWKRLFS